MKPNPEHQVNKFYKRLKFDKDTHFLISYFRKWRKNAQKELNKRKAT